jgi:hypothetical protein
MNQIRIITLAALLVLGAGCAQLQPGNDAVVVRSEQVQQTIFDVVDTFLAYEKANRDALWAINPGVKKAADDLRRTFPLANATALNMLDAYKHNRTLENKVNLMTALAVIEQARTEAQAWLIQSGGEQ